MRISVCMATYNGGLYIEEQLRSILPQLAEDDEVIICDDCSSDDTLVRVAAVGDKRVKVYVNEYNLGYVKNFEKAVSLSRGDYIFLSDQDDIWPSGRVGMMLHAFEYSGKSVVVGNFDVFEFGTLDFRSYSVNLSEKYNRVGLLNFIKMLRGGIPYFGCCMGIRKEFLRFYIPFPDSSVSHDIWLAIISNVRGEIFHIPDVVLHRRIHESNLTVSSRPLSKKIGTRIKWLRLFFRCYF